MSTEAIIWAGSPDPHVSILRLLASSGLQPLVVASAEELAMKAGEASVAFIVVDASYSEEVAEKMASAVRVWAPRICKPLVFLGLDAEPILSRVPSSAGISLVSDPDELESACKDFLEAALREHVAETLERPGDPSKLVGTYGGRVLARAGTAADFDDATLVPDVVSRDAIYKALELTDKVNPWLGAHVRRVSFLASSISSAFGTEPGRDTAIRVVGLLCGIGFAKGRLEIGRLNFMVAKEEADKSEFLEAIHSSAVFLAENIASPRCTKLGRTLHDVFRGVREVHATSIEEHKQHVFDAQCLALVDIADRCCWASGQWDSRAVGKVMRYLRSPASIVTDRELISAVMRVLIEALGVSANVTNMTMVRAPLTGEETEEERKRKLKQASQPSVGDEELLAEVCDLRPGMRLTRDVVALDGKTLIQARTHLDDDIIWRLWELAALRSIPTVLVVERRFHMSGFMRSRTVERSRKLTS